MSLESAPSHTSRPAPTQPLPRGWVIGRAAGAPIVVGPTWLIAALVLAFIFGPTAANVFPDAHGPVVLASVLFVVLLFGSVLAHEVAHALVAKARGHRVVSIALTGFGGVTRYDARGAAPGSQALIASAGPVTNLVLALAFWLGLKAMGGISFSTPTGAAVLVLVLYAGALANAFLGLFNLLPSLPMDGGAILEGVVWKVTGNRDKGTVIAAWLGRILAVAIVVWALSSQVWGEARGSIFTVFWALFIGSILFSGANKSLAAMRQRRAIDALDLSALLRPARGIDASASVAEVAEAMDRHRVDYVVVTDFGDTAIGYIEADVVSGVPHSERADTNCLAVLTQLAAAPCLPSDGAGEALLDAVREGARHTPVLVVRAAPQPGFSGATGAPVGLVWVSDVVKALNRN